MSFRQRAEHLISLGYSIVPSGKAGQHFSTLTAWQGLSTCDLVKVDEWLKTGYAYDDDGGFVKVIPITPDQLWICVATPDGVGCLDVDDLDSCLAKGMPPLPELCRLITTPSGGIHLPFIQTEETRKIGNCKVRLSDDPKLPDGDDNPAFKTLIFEFKASAAAWCAEGQTRIGDKKHPAGDYTPTDDPIMVGVPTDILEWLTEHHSGTKRQSGPAQEWTFIDDWDEVEFLEHHHAEALGGPFMERGSLYVPVISCPVCGEDCRQAKRGAQCKFIFSGVRFGYTCKFCGIEGEGATARFESEMAEKYPDFERWEQPIYEPEAIEMDDEPDEVFLEPIIRKSKVAVKVELRSRATPSETTTAGDEYAKDAAAGAAPAGKVETPPTGGEDFALSEGSVKKVPRRYIVKKASDFEMLEQKWFWPGIIPKAEVTLFAGPVAKGKSLAALTLVACTSTGANWPNGALNTMGPRRVLMGTTEDRIETTVKPRLFALGADMDKILFVVRIEDGNASRPFDLKKDIGLLNKALKENPDIALIVLDPITGFYGDGDGNDNKYVRPTLEKVNKVCHEREVTVIAIVHENKSKEVGAVNQILGAGSLSQVVRGGFRFSNDPNPEFEGGKIMANIKSNLSKEGGGLRFRIEGQDVTVDDGSVSNVAVIRWSGAHSLSADEVMGEAGDAAVERKQNGPSRSPKQDEAVALIRRFCANGPRRSPELYSVALAAQISDGTLKKVKQDMHAAKTLEYKRDGKDQWWTRMPEFPGTESQQLWWSLRPGAESDEVMRDWDFPEL